VRLLLKAELHQQREELHCHRRHHHQHQQPHQPTRASSNSFSGDCSGSDRRPRGSKMASGAVSAVSTTATNSSSPAGSPLTRRTGGRILPSILGRFTSHRSASSDRLKRSSQRRTESSENINVSLSSSPGSPASMGGPSSPSRPWESHLMVWNSRSALSLNQDEQSTISQTSDTSPGDGCPAGDDDSATSPASPGPSSDVSYRLQPWRTEVSHQQQHSEWMLDLTSSGQDSRRSSTATVNSDAPNP